MKLYDLKPNVPLCENVTDYLTTVSANLKSKSSDELFSGDKPLVDLQRLAVILTSLKILGNHDHRQNLTTDDIGINPVSSQHLHDFLDSIPKNGRGIPRLTGNVLDGIKKFAPNTFKRETEALKVLKGKDEKAKEAFIKEFDALITKVEKMKTDLKKLSSGEEEEKP